jgi:uncharacterized protein YcgL (UPF0745 family)
MKCFVYRSRKRNGTYVYLRERDAFAVLPPALADGLGVLEFAMELELTPERRLATQEATRVLQHLHEVGFHVQFPPNEKLILRR